jgi:hypothetical protein
MKSTRATAGTRAYLDLQNKARSESRPTDELLTLYILEGFLARLSASGHRQQYILKGDLQAQSISNDTATVLRLVREIAATPLDDGIAYLHAEATAEIIRDEDEYSGVRVSMPTTLASAKIRFHVDVNVGDPISPAPQDIELPRILGGSISLRGYPIAMIHAEKIVTAVSRGTANTRWRDFGDIYRLACVHALSGDELTQAIAAVASGRGVALEPLANILDGYADIAQGKYAAWRRKQVHIDLPADFQDVLDLVIGFADSVIVGDVSGRTWNPDQLKWDQRHT